MAHIRIAQGGYSDVHQSIAFAQGLITRRVTHKSPEQFFDLNCPMRKRLIRRCLGQGSGQTVLYVYMNTQSCIYITGVIFFDEVPVGSWIYRSCYKKTRKEPTISFYQKANSLPILISCLSI